MAGPIETSLQIEETAAAWVARRESGDWRADDQAALDAWLNASTARRVAFLRLHATWDRLSRLSRLGAIVSSKTNDSMHLQDQSTTYGIHIPALETPKTPFVMRGELPAKRRAVSARPYALATALIVACTAGILWYLTSNQGIPYETGIGTITNVSLADGTMAVIDSGSKMTVRMNARERHVELERGAIFLNIAKDAARPFVVDVGDKRLTDEGTQFSVRRGLNELVVVVADGRIQLETRGSKAASQINIEAGSEAHASGPTFYVRPLSALRIQELLSWRTGHLVFHDTALPDAVAEFNRYSERKMLIGSASLADLRIGGSFRATDIEGFLSLLQRGFPVQVDETNAQIILTHR